MSGQHLGELGVNLSYCHRVSPPKFHQVNKPSPRGIDTQRFDGQLASEVSIHQVLQHLLTPRARIDVDVALQGTIG